MKVTAALAAEVEPKRVRISPGDIGPGRRLAALRTPDGGMICVAAPL